MNNYYPLTRVSKKLGNEQVEQMIVTPTEKKGWRYLFAWDDGDRMIIEANHHHKITNVSFTHKYKGIWMSLKRAQTKWFKICRYLGAASCKWNFENVN